MDLLEYIEMEADSLASSTPAISEKQERGGSPYGLEVVYQDGIFPDLDEALYEAIGGDSNDEGCGLRTRRRDMFWRCADIETAILLRMELAEDLRTHPDFSAAAALRQLTFEVITEDEHWDRKLVALSEDTDPLPTDQAKL